MSLRTMWRFWRETNRQAPPGTSFSDRVRVFGIALEKWRTRV